MTYNAKDKTETRDKRTLTVEKERERENPINKDQAHLDPHRCSEEAFEVDHTPDRRKGDTDVARCREV